MANRGTDKPEKSQEELDHLGDVTSEQENMDIARVTPSSSPPPNVQGGKRIADPGASSSSKVRRLTFCGDRYSCRVCGQPFGSQNAVNAHMRKHKEPKKKASTAFFPPPSFTRQGKPSLEKEFTPGSSDNDANRRHIAPEEKTSLLLKLKQEEAASALLKLKQGGLLASSSSFRPVGLNVDLNKPAGSCSLHEEEAGRFDLNKLPPPEEEDGDNGQNVDSGGRPIN